MTHEHRLRPLRPLNGLRTAFGYCCDQRWVHFLLIACLMTYVAMFLHVGRLAWADFLDHTVIDKYFSVRGAKEPVEVAEKLPYTKNIVMVETNHTIPRPVLAKLLRKLHLAKVVAVDMMFVDHEKELDAEEKAW